MKSVVSVVCLLATLAAANPVEQQRRGLPMMSGGLLGGGGGVAQTHASGSASQTQSTAGMGLGGAYQSAQSSTSSYSIDTLSSQFFDPINGILAQLNGAMTNGILTQSMASQYMQSLAMQMQGLLVGLPQCACMNSANTMTMFSQVFSQVTQALMGIQNYLGVGSMGGILGGFGQLAGAVSSFQSSVQSSSYSQGYMGAINPFLSQLGGVLPGFAQFKK